MTFPVIRYGVPLRGLAAQRKLVVTQNELLVCDLPPVTERAAAPESRLFEVTFARMLIGAPTAPSPVTLQTCVGPPLSEIEGAECVCSVIRSVRVLSVMEFLTV